MRRPRPIVIIATLAVAAAAAGSAAVSAVSAATPAGAWTRVSGPTQPGAQLGLARTDDGVLHAIWNRGNSGTSIFETRFSRAGKAAGTSTVATGWPGNGGLDLLAMPDGTLRLFTPGTGGINTFTAPGGGDRWSLQSGVGWGGAVAESAYVIGATLTKSGQPVTAWRGSAAEGVPPGSIPPNGYEGGMTESFLATDAGSGAVVLAGATNAGQGGVYVQQVLPGTGPHVVLPPLAKEWSDGLSSRIGAPGVYVAYTDGTAARLYRYGGATKTLARGPFWSATACAGPDGRLWVVWGDATDGLVVTRSNRAAGGFEPVQKLRLPAGSGGLTFVQCEGSAGPLDLFADVGVGSANQQGFWHTHVLAELTLKAAVAATKSGSRVTVSVRDAGDPLAAAVVSLGGRRLKTDARGHASLALRPGAYTATATAPGYLTVSTRVHV